MVRKQKDRSRRDEECLRRALCRSDVLGGPAVATGRRRERPRPGWRWQVKKEASCSKWCTLEKSDVNKSRCHGGLRVVAIHASQPKLHAVSPECFRRASLCPAQIVAWGYVIWRACHSPELGGAARSLTPTLPPNRVSWLISHTCDPSDSTADRRHFAHVIKHHFGTS